MAKSRKNSTMKTISNSLPVVNKGLENVGRTAKVATKASLPIIEKGVGIVYDTMEKGLNLGVKGVKRLTKSSRKFTGGKRTHKSRRSRRHRRY